MDPVEFYAGFALSFYTLTLILGLSTVYELLSNYFDKHTAVYVNRKLIHAVCGGFVALTLPYLFKTPLIPSIYALLLALLLLLLRRKGGLEWFQVREDANEVTFVLAWSLSTLVTWLLYRDMVVAILPALFISFGDAVTGFVRACVAGRRVKHWAGNVAMACITVPLGYVVMGVYGAFTGLLAALAERIDKPLDDNIIISIVTVTALTLYKFVSLWG